MGFSERSRQRPLPLGRLSHSLTADRRPAKGLALFPVEDGRALLAQRGNGLGVIGKAPGDQRFEVRVQRIPGQNESSSLRRRCRRPEPKCSN
jgi:hypothetical protein